MCVRFGLVHQVDTLVCYRMIFLAQIMHEYNSKAFIIQYHSMS